MELSRRNVLTGFVAFLAIAIEILLIIAGFFSFSGDEAESACSGTANFELTEATYLFLHFSR